MTGKRADTLLALMYLIEPFTLARAWDDLTDDEFFWEPVPTAWSVRARDDCVIPDPFGAGEWVVDFAIPLPMPIARPVMSAERPPGTSCRSWSSVVGPVCTASRA